MLENRGKPQSDILKGTKKKQNGRSYERTTQFRIRTTEKGRHAEDEYLGSHMTKLKKEFKTLFTFGEADTEEEQTEVTAGVASGDVTETQEEETEEQPGEQDLTPAARTPVPGGAAAARPASQGTKCTSRRLTWRRNLTGRYTVKEDIKHWKHDPE